MSSEISPLAIYWQMTDELLIRQSITDWSWGIIAPKQQDLVAHVLMRSVGFLRTFQHIQWLVCLANRCETLSKSQPNLYHFMGISWSHISFPPTSQFRAIQQAVFCLCKLCIHQIYSRSKITYVFTVNKLHIYNIYTIRIYRKKSEHQPLPMAL